jgi:hypothetical protein
MISETEENLTAMAELHVPQLPVVEQERPVVQQPDYDLDIDAEMAQLFGTPNRGARSQNRGVQDDHGFGAVQRSPHPSNCPAMVHVSRMISTNSKRQWKRTSDAR